jgi:hypothetical protein
MAISQRLAPFAAFLQTTRLAMRLVLLCVASTPLALAQTKPAPIAPDRLPDSYQIYSLLMPGQVFTDMDSGQPWAISGTTINEDDMNPKLAPEATLQPPEDNPRAFNEAVNDYNQRKKERLALTRRFKLDRPTCCWGPRIPRSSVPRTPQ